MAATDADPARERARLNVDVSDCLTRLNSAVDRVAEVPSAEPIISELRKILAEIEEACGLNGGAQPNRPQIPETATKHLPRKRSSDWKDEAKVMLARIEGELVWSRGHNADRGTGLIEELQRIIDELRQTL